ncbi:MAG: LysM peptidoglycan-binding domain-containing protein [Spirochaetota bacterium]
MRKPVPFPKALFFAVFLVLLTPIRTIAIPLAPRNGQTPPFSASPSPSAAAKGPLESLQGPAGPMYYSLSFEEHPLVKRYLDAYIERENLDWIEKALERGRPYLGHISERLVHYGAPRELRFLPVIESEFRDYATSPSGAKGMWQFMQNSIYPDMRIDRWTDDRKDFWKATDSAIKKLLYNYEKLGDWFLALAAYNCGLGKMQRSIAAAGFSDYWALAEGGYLPSETVRYVPKFLAAAALCSYPGRHGLPVSWENYPEWTRIPVEKPVDIRILADRAGVPLELLKRGNAELNYPVTPPDSSPYFLKVPSDYADVITKTLGDPEIRLMRFHVYTVREGDTLYALSRHYGVSVDMIRRYNLGVRPALLQIGTHLVIPAFEEVPSFAGQHTAALAESPSGYSDRYTVRKGDTLWSISRRFGVSLEELARANSLDLSGIIREGTILKIPERGM